MIDDDEGGGFTQVIRPAAGAPAPKTTGANSVFALGGGSAAEARRDDGRKRAPPQRLRGIETLRSCGALDRDQFALAMQIDRAQATKMLSNLKQIGEVEAIREKGKITVFRLKGQATTRAGKGFKNWLAKQGSDSAEGRQWLRKKAVAKPTSEAAASTPAAPIAASKLACGLFNTGELLIECEGQTLRLARSDVRALVAYLDSVAAALVASADVAIDVVSG